MADNEIQDLREALDVSPDNGPLRRRLARVLLTHSRWSDAETELRTLLRRSPADAALNLDLARAFEAQGKHAEASALLEVRSESGAASPPELVLLARVLLVLGDRDRAVSVYGRALAADPAVVDEELAAKLGAIRVAESAPSDAKDADDAVDVERPTITFQDVGGMAEVKEEIRIKIVHPLVHAELYRSYGKTVGGGVLMYGPPGCGKTYLARATAGEVRAAFVAIGVSDVLDMWHGESERKLHEVFERARRNRPCVLFFDEVDALGASRSEMRSGGGRQLVNQFLEEMDGVRTSNDGVLILAATNAPWHVDSAFRRPGRFDRVLFVAPPDAAARADILRAQLNGKPQHDIDFAGVAARLKEFSGADLKGVVDRAVEDKLRDAIRTGIPAPIVTADLVRAASKAAPSTREWFGTARNYALHANQAGIYDDVLRYLKLS
ncbi:MAG: AAA family ATPase [Planctomycetes bacterium]|nr:AAA family ATPase [Planctomycetota bacterium]